MPLKGLKHSSPLHATHLTGIASGLPGLSFERSLSTTNKMADQRISLEASLISCTGTGLFSASLNLGYLASLQCEALKRSQFSRF